MAQGSQPWGIPWTRHSPQAPAGPLPGLGNSAFHQAFSQQKNLNRKFTLKGDQCLLRATFCEMEQVRAGKTRLNPQSFPVGLCGGDGRAHGPAPTLPPPLPRLLSPLPRHVRQGGGGLRATAPHTGGQVEDRDAGWSEGLPFGTYSPDILPHSQTPRCQTRKLRLEVLGKHMPHGGERSHSPTATGVDHRSRGEARGRPCSLLSPCPTWGAGLGHTWGAAPPPVLGRRACRGWAVADPPSPGVWAVPSPDRSPGVRRGTLHMA